MIYLQLQYRFAGNFGTLCTIRTPTLYINGDSDSIKVMSVVKSSEISPGGPFKAKKIGLTSDTYIRR